MLAGQNDAGKKIQNWFSEAIATSKLPQRETAELLDLPQSAISKIRLGGRALGATERLTLHEQLDLPRPELGFRKAASGNTRDRSEDGGDFRRLFDLTFKQVEALEQKTGR